MSQGKREIYRRQKLQLWWMRNKLTVLAVLGIVSVLALITSWAVGRWMRLPEVPTTKPPTTVINPSIDGDTTDEYENIVPLDSDRRDGVYTFLVAGKDTAGGGNTDTILLITYDAINKTVDAMNIPRDTMVNIPNSVKKINAVYNYNKGSDKSTQLEKGTTALKTEVEKLTGIYPDFYVIVEWDAVGELVDAIDGVWFDVPYDMDYDDPTPGQELYIHQEAGYRLLTGDDAMQVIRHRKNNDGSHSLGDVGRLEVQQDFLIAMAKQCLTPNVLLKAPALIEIFLEQVTTDLTMGNLLAFAKTAYGINVEENVKISTMPYIDHYRYASYVLPVEDELLAVINDGLNPYLKDITADDLELLYKKDSAGGMGVTNGELADPTIANPPVYPTKEEDEVPEVEDNEEPGTEPEGENPTFPQPEPVLPEVTEPTEPEVTEPEPPAPSVEEPDDIPETLQPVG